VFTSVSTGILHGTGITCNTLLASTSVSTGNLYSINSSITNLRISGAFSADAANASFYELKTLSTNDATDESTGSLKVVGGAGITKNLYVGESVFAKTSISSASLYSLNQSTTNAVFTNVSTSTLSVTTFTPTSVSSGSIYSINQTTTNGVFTSLSTGTLHGTGITCSTVLASTSVSTGLLLAINQSCSNAVFTNLSTGTLHGTGITCSTLLASTSVSTGLLLAINQTSSNAVFTSVSTGTLHGTGITCSTLLASTSVSTGVLLAVNQSTSNAVFTSVSTGTLHGTGITCSTLLASTSISTNNLDVGGGVNALAANISSYGINCQFGVFTNSITTPSLLASTSISTGLLSSTNQSTTNAVFTNVSTSSLSVTTFTPTSVSSGSIYSLNQTTTNGVFTNVSIGTLHGTGITCSTLLASTSVSTGLLLAVNQSTTNGVFTNLSTGTLHGTGITCSTLLASTSVSTGLLLSTNQTTTNGVFINLSAGTLYATGITSSTLIASTSVSTGLLLSTNQSTTNGTFTNLSAGTLYATGVTSSTLLASTSVSSGLLLSTNQSTSNAVFTNVSSGTLRISGTSTNGSFFIENDIVHNLQFGIGKDTDPTFPNQLYLTQGGVISQSWVVASGNNTFDINIFNEQSFTVTLTVGTYSTTADFVSHLDTQINLAATISTFTVSYSSITGFFTFAKDVTLWNAGQIIFSGGSSIATLLGYNVNATVDWTQNIVSTKAAGKGGSNFNITPVTKFTSTINSTNPTTASVIISGGVGIVKDACINGNAYVLGGNLYPNINTTTGTNFLVNVYGGNFTANGNIYTNGYGLFLQGGGITSAGNVNATSITTGTLRATDKVTFTGYTAGNGNLIVSNTAGTNTSIDIFSTNGNTAQFFVTNADWGLFTNNSFGPLNLVNSGVTRLTIPTNGNVGIGTITPGYKLDVQGTFNASTSVSSASLYSTNQTTTNGVFTSITTGSVAKNSGLFTLTGTFGTIVTLSGEQSGILSIVNKTGGGTHAAWLIQYSTNQSHASASTIIANNISLQFSGTANSSVQVKSGNLVEYTTCYGYTNFYSL
jgi:hypothetical protein